MSGDLSKGKSQKYIFMSNIKDRMDGVDDIIPNMQLVVDFIDFFRNHIFKPAQNYLEKRLNGYTREKAAGGYRSFLNGIKNILLFIIEPDKIVEKLEQKNLEDTDFKSGDEFQPALEEMKKVLKTEKEIRISFKNISDFNHWFYSELLNDKDIKKDLLEEDQNRLFILKAKCDAIINHLLQKKGKDERLQIKLAKGVIYFFTKPIEYIFRVAKTINALFEDVKLINFAFYAAMAAIGISLAFMSGASVPVILLSFSSAVYALYKISRRIGMDIHNKGNLADIEDKRDLIESIAHFHAAHMANKKVLGDPLESIPLDKPEKKEMKKMEKHNDVWQKAWSFFKYNALITFPVGLLLGAIMLKAHLLGGVVAVLGVPTLVIFGAIMVSCLLGTFDAYKSDKAAIKQENYNMAQLEHYSKLLGGIDPNKITNQDLADILSEKKAEYVISMLRVEFGIKEKEIRDEVKKDIRENTKVKLLRNKTTLELIKESVYPRAQIKKALSDVLNINESEISPISKYKNVEKPILLGEVNGMRSILCIVDGKKFEVQIEANAFGGAKGSTVETKFKNKQYVPNHDKDNNHGDYVSYFADKALKAGASLQKACSLASQMIEAEKENDLDKFNQARLKLKDAMIYAQVSKVAVNPR